MEISKQIQDEISLRQRGMCGHCGKVIDEIEGAFKEYITLNSDNKDNPTKDNSVLVCNYCISDIRKMTKTPNYDIKKYNFNYAGYENYSADNKLNDFKDEVEKAFTFLETSKDLRASRNLINEKIKTLKSLNFARGDYEELYSRLSSQLNKLIENQKSEFAKLEVKQTENYESIKTKLNELFEKINNTDIDAQQIKDFRNNLIKIQSDMNSLNLNRENKDELIPKFTELFDVLSRRQDDEREKYEMECSENYLNLKNEVENVCNFSKDHPIFKEARERLIETQKKFKGLKLKKDNREELFNKIQNAFNELNIRQDADRAVSDQEADENYSKAKPVVDEAVSFADNATNFKQARTALVDAQNSIKLLKMRKEQRDELFGNIRDSFDRLNERQSEEKELFDKETEKNYTKIQDQLTDIENDLNNDPEFNKIRDLLIAIQAEIRVLSLKREQKNSTFSKIRELFAVLDAKRKIYRENKTAQKSSKLNNVYNNLKSKLARIEESISWDFKTLNFQKEKLANLVDSEDQKIIDDVNSKIHTFSERIKEKEDNIAEINKRLAEIEKEISNISKNKADKSSGKESREEHQDETFNQPVEELKDENIEIQAEPEQKEENENPVNTEAE